MYIVDDDTEKKTNNMFSSSSVSSHLFILINTVLIVFVCWPQLSPEDLFYECYHIVKIIINIERCTHCLHFPLWQIACIRSKSAWTTQSDGRLQDAPGCRFRQNSNQCVAQHTPYSKPDGTLQSIGVQQPQIIATARVIVVWLIMKDLWVLLL